MNKNFSLKAFPAVILLAMAVAGCTTDGIGKYDVNGTNNWIPADTDDPKVLAEAAFVRGNFGIAEQNYRAIVAKNDRDVDALIGLGASYDMLGRFDLAEESYQKALATGRNKATVLNNLGYSHYLRGDRKAALDKLYAAKNLEPDNPRINANIDLVLSDQSKD